MRPKGRPRRERFIPALLRIPHRAAAARIYDALIAAGMTDLRPPHLPVFQHLDPEGDHLTALAEKAQMTKQSMGYLVDYLEEHGYVERVPDPADGRAKLIRFTSRGDALTEVARKSARETEAEWAALLGKERMAQVRGALEDLVAWLEGEE